MKRGSAIVMRAYGPPAVLEQEEIALPPLAPQEIRVRSLFSAVNHSDLEIRAGHWPIRASKPFPYTPGLEVVGEIVERGAAVGNLDIGQRVITMMQGLGGVRAERPGGYAEYVSVDAAATAVIPLKLDPQAVAALGLASVTAYEGLRRLGAIAGRRIAVTDAAGGVGSAAIALAKAMGASVIGIVSRASAAEYVRSLGAIEVLEASEVIAGALLPGSIDGVLDTVAGTSFGVYVDALRPGASLALVGAVGGNRVCFDAFRLLEITLTGYSSESLDGNLLRTALASICAYLQQRVLAIPEQTLLPLGDAAKAHVLLEQHAVRGRILLVPA